MRNRRTRRYRHHSNGRNYGPHGSDGAERSGLGSTPFSNGRSRNNFKPQQSAEKLAEKYNSLAKEALSSGDNILSENYLQHADHFTRIIVEKSLNKNQSRSQVGEVSASIIADKAPAENNKSNQDKGTEEKKE